MAKMTLNQFKQVIKEKLVTAGEISAAAGIGDLVYDNTYNNFDENSVYDLISIKNNVNNKGLVYLEVRTAVNGTPVQCTYSLDSFNPGYVSSASHIYLMGLYSGVENGSVCDDKVERNSHSEGFGSTDSLFCYERPYTGNAFLATGGGHGGTTYNTTVEHVCLQCQGLNYDPDISSAGDPNGFYEGMALADIPVLSNYTMTVIANNVSLAESPEPPTPTVDPYTQIELWRNWSKRDKSTKRPDIPGEILNVALLDDTDVLNPSFILRKKVFDYNYAKWGGMYYTCKVTNLSATQCRVDCTIDELATAKDYIQAGTAYIERASVSTNKLIADALNPTTEEAIVKHNKCLVPVTEYDNGCYIVITSANDYSQPNGGLHVYQMDEENFKKLYKALWDTEPQGQPGQTPPDPLTLEERQTILNSILSCKRVPFKFSTATPGYMHFANFVTVDAKGIDLDYTSVYNIPLGTIDIPFASADWGYSVETYLDHEPYTTGLIYLPFIGNVKLDLDVFATLRHVKIKAQVDKVTCGITYSIMDDSGFVDKVISTYSGNCGSDIPISAGGYDQRGMQAAVLAGIGGAIGLGIGAASLNPLGIVGGAASVAGAWHQYSKSSEIQTQINGSLSTNLGFYVWDGYVHIMTITKKPVYTDIEDVRALYGLPYCKRGSLNISGYVQTRNAQISTPYPTGVRAAVNAALDSGLYIE